jgi:hypothetical protein
LCFIQFLTTILRTELRSNDCRFEDFEQCERIKAIPWKG